MSEDREHYGSKIFIDGTVHAEFSKEGTMVWFIDQKGIRRERRPSPGETVESLVRKALAGEISIST